MGDNLVTGKPRVFKTGQKPSIEPSPIAGKPGSIPATVSTLPDGRVRLDFINPRPDEINVLITARRR